MKATTLAQCVARIVSTFFSAAFCLTAAVALGNTNPVANDDTYPYAATTFREAHTILPVLRNDTDADGDTLTIVAVTDGLKGTVTISSPGYGVSYRPGPNFDGNDTFTYTIDDGHGGQAAATVTLTNASPSAVDDTLHWEGLFYPMDVLANDSDAEDGAWIVIVAATNGQKGTTTADSYYNSIEYTPGPTFDGNDTFTYTIRDFDGATATATVTLVNSYPVAHNDTLRFDPAFGYLDQASVLANDSDPDGDEMTIVSVTNGTKGTTEMFWGWIRYIPGPEYDGTDTFSYTIQDNAGATATATVTLSNNSPVAVADSFHASAISSRLDVIANDSDSDVGDFIYVISITDGLKGTTRLEYGQIVYTPGPGFDGNDTFSYTIRDQVGATATATVTLTNTYPTAANDTFHADPLTLSQLNLLSNDADPDGDPFWVDSTTNGAKGTTGVTPMGRVYYQPGPGFDGNDTFTYTIRDSSGGPATATVTLTNTYPTAVNDTFHADPLILSQLNLLSNDADPDGDPFWVDSTTNGAKGTTGVTTMGRTYYQPGSEFDGNDTFTYTIRDSSGAPATATVTLTNTYPVAVNDTVAATGIFEGIYVIGNDSDPDGDSFFVESTTNGAKGTTFLAPSGLIFYTPGPNCDGNDTFTYTIRDMAGGRATATVTLTNSAPVAQNDVAATEEDVVVSIPVLDNDTDSGVLHVQAVTQGAHGEAIINGLNVDYLPAPNWSGTDSFTYTVSDGFMSATATVSVTVSPVNDLPAAENDSVTTAEDVAASIAVLSNDNDIEGDTLSIQSVTQGAHGSVAIAGTNVNYVPVANWHGTDSFAYTVSDGQGGTATATVSVSVTSVADAPVAAGDNVTLAEDSVATIAALANDSDADGDTVSIQSVTQGAHGVVAIAGTNITYTPEANWNGSDSFSYTITDGNGGTAQATVTVTVTATNDAPVFTVNPFTKPGATIGVPYTGSIAANASDVDTADTLTFSKVDGPSWLNVAANGALSGVAPAGTSGDNSFTVRASDVGGLSTDAVMVITVGGSLPAGWAGSDIGGVGIPGGATESNGTFTVSSSGAGITGATDSFHFVSDALTGDGEIRARVTSQANTNPWAKAGVMIRESGAADSKHALMAITPGNGFSFEYRTVTAGASSSVAGPALNSAPNNWVRLTRSGSLITAYTSANGTTWTQVGTVVVSMASTLEAGLAVTSANNAVLSTATFDNVSVTHFPAPWQTAQIGAPGSQGSAEYFNLAYTLKGAGNLSGSADNVSFVYQTLSGDGEIKARVTAPGNTGGTNARLGVMVRETLTSGARYVFMGINGDSGYTWQRRNSTGGSISTSTSGTGTAPNIWVRIVRSGNTLYGYKSTNGVTWTLVDNRNISMATNIYVGLVVTSGSTSTLNTSSFDNVTVVP